MARKSSILVIVGLVVLLVSVGVWAQNRQDPTAVTTVPHVMSGENVGVRLTGGSDKSGRLTGTLVVKVNGQWVEVVSPAGVIQMGK